MVVLSAKILPKLRLSVDEFLRADLPQGRRYELVNGVVEVSPPPGIPHDFVVGRLAKALHEYWADHPDTIAHISQHAALVIPRRRTVRGPDFALYREFEDDPDPLAWKRFTPFWVAETTSRRWEARDLVEKRREYWRAGVEEYWIVHRREKGILVLTRGKEAWRERNYSRDQEARSSVLRGFAVPVERLFPNR
jgi:Uma2 family endonuclease